MDHDAYFRDLADYYNYSRIPSKVMTGAAEIRAEFNQVGSWVRECAESLQATLAKRRVLEVACGSGRWTQFVADVAKRVLATDPCPALLDYGRRLNLPNIDWLECDAFSLNLGMKNQTPATWSRSATMTTVVHSKWWIRSLQKIC